MKGTNEFLVTLTPYGKRLHVMLNYSVWYVLDLRHLEVSCQPLSALSLCCSMIHLITVIRVFLLEVVCESQSIRATHAKGKARHHMLRLRSQSQRIAIIYSESLSMRDVLYMVQGERFTLQPPASSLSLSVLLESTHYKMLVKASTD